MKDLTPELQNCIKSDFVNYVPPSWDVLFMRMVYLISTKSKDPSTKIGSVIVGPDHEIISVGYNGIPRGVNDNVLERFERPEKYNYFEHAERNAILSVARVGGPSLKGCIMYTQSMPCSDCARSAIQSGIKCLVLHRPYEKIFDYLAKSWQNSCDAAAIMVQESGIEIRYVEEFVGCGTYIRGKYIEV